MKKPFAVGDRVAVYSKHERVVGTITDTDGTCNLMDIQLTDGSLRCVHPKQCRRLKPRTKRRRVYLDTAMADDPIYATRQHPDEVVFVEVRPKKRGDV